MTNNQRNLSSDFIADSHVEDAYLGKHALRLTALTSEQMQDVYAQRGIEFPIEVSSVMHYLLKNPDAAQSEMSKALAIPHQLSAQRVTKLLSLGLGTKRADPLDARRSLLNLTEKGHQQALLLVSCMEDTALIYRELFQEIGCDLTGAIADAIAAIETTPLSQRFAKRFAEKELSQ